MVFFEPNRFPQNQEIAFNRDLISYFGYNKRTMVKERFVRQLWISLGIIAGSIVIAAGMLVFLSGDIAARADAIVSDRAIVQSKTDALANLAQLESEAPQAAQYQSAIDQLLPDQYGLVTFTQWIAQLGGKYNVTANASFQGSIVPSAGTTPGNAQFSFSVEGSSENIAAFLEGMNAKSTGFLVTLTSFDVTGSGSNENMTGQGTLFFR
jgi:Tfp pilus assembly protein PilO